MVCEAMRAAVILKEEFGVEARVVDMHTVKPLDRMAVLKARDETGAILTAEEHQKGGFGALIAAAACEGSAASSAAGKAFGFDMIGMEDRFGESGAPWELMTKFGLIAENIAKRAGDMVRVKREGDSDVGKSTDTPLHQPVLRRHWRRGEGVVAPRALRGGQRPGLGILQQIGEKAEIVRTIWCGDNLINQETEKILAAIETLIAESKPDVVVAGPAFGAGRYGLACGMVAPALLGKAQNPRHHRALPRESRSRDLPQGRLHLPLRGDRRWHAQGPSGLRAHGAQTRRTRQARPRHRRGLPAEGLPQQ